MNCERIGKHLESCGRKASKRSNLNDWGSNRDRIATPPVLIEIWGLNDEWAL